MVYTRPRKVPSKLTQEIVRELLDYDKKTGVLTWRERSIEWFDPDGWKGALRAQRAWNGHWAGKPALNARQESAGQVVHLYGSVLGEGHAAHRIIFLLRSIIATTTAPTIVGEICARLRAGGT